MIMRPKKGNLNKSSHSDNCPFRIGLIFQSTGISLLSTSIVLSTNTTKSTLIKDFREGFKW
jgi:hypothetical protein